MSGFEWFLLVVVVIAVPLVVAVVVTLWTLEQARQRNRKYRESSDGGAEPVKRQASRSGSEGGTAVAVAGTGGSGSGPRDANEPAGRNDAIGATPDTGSANSDGDGASTSD